MAEHDDRTSPEIDLAAGPSGPAAGPDTAPGRPAVPGALAAERQDTRSLAMPGTPGDPPDPPPASPAARGAVIGLGAALVLSLGANAALLLRGPSVAPAPVAAALPPACPPAVVCPPAVECPACEICEVCPEPAPDDGAFAETGRMRPPPVDEAAAAEGEAHLTHAETVGERDPVELAAQRRVADGVDRILASHSAAAARRFFSRNLPSFASMDCAFRDPAAAEHVRMQLRPMNELLPEAERLSEADLARFERDLRCPRE